MPQVDIGSGNGLVSGGKKPLPEPMLTEIYVAVTKHNEFSDLFTHDLHVASVVRYYYWVLPHLHWGPNAALGQS